SRNSTGSFNTNNKVMAIKASDGTVFWTFNGAGTSSVDYIVGMPYVDYVRNRLYVASRAGSAGGQRSLWVIDTRDGTPVACNTPADCQLGHIESSPTLSYDGTTLYVGDKAGNLHAINAATLALKWTLALGAPATLNGFVWEDWTIPGRLYFSTADGNVRSVQDNGASGSVVWTTPVAGPGTPLLLEKIFVGSSDGTVHQLTLTGTDEKQFTVETGVTVGDVSTEDTGQIFVGTSTGKLYKINLTNGALP
ncbi:MAG: PQQ-binding-like beta-propeller repeat protein, partial [Candidatus Binatota bacterium]